MSVGPPQRPGGQGVALGVLLARGVVTQYVHGRVDQNRRDAPGHHAEEDQDRMRPEGVALDTGPSGLSADRRVVIA